MWTFILILVSVGLVMIMSFMGIGSENSKTESLQTDMSVLHFIIAFVSAAIISPVYEEIFYRGFLYRFFQSRYGIFVRYAAQFSYFHGCPHPDL
nr:CPBP family intramembrane glutamic endopeptidase [Planococcus glaciei]